MKSRKYPIVIVRGVGVGILKEENPYHSVVEFNDGRNRWSIILEKDEYTIIDDISIGYEEIE